MAKTRMMTRKGECYLCGAIGQTEEHSCHRTGPNAVHDSMNGSTNRKILHEDAQRAFEAHWGTRGYFMEIFGRNYLDGEEI